MSIYPAFPGNFAVSGVLRGYELNCERGEVNFFCERAQSTLTHGEVAYRMFLES